MTKSKPFTRNLPVMLTMDDLADRRDELVGHLEEIDELEEKRKKVVAEFKTKVDRSKARTKILARVIRSREELRPVECHRIADLERLILVVVREDTGEIVEERELTDDERTYYAQKKLEFEKSVPS